MHILLRPVPVLSRTLERFLATVLFVAAKCTNINSAISRQAPLAITGNKMAPRGARKNTLLRNVGLGTHAARSHVSSSGEQPYRQKGLGGAEGLTVRPAVLGRRHGFAAAARVGVATQPSGPGQPGQAIGARSAPMASNRPGQPLDSQRADPLARPGH
jgi:hypothetical protein